MIFFLIILWLLSGLVPTILVLNRTRYPLDLSDRLDIFLLCVFAILGPATWPTLIDASLKD